LAIEPCEEVIGEERRDTELRGPSRLGKERLLSVHRYVEAVGSKMVDPRLVWFGNEQLTIESREDALERCQAPIVGTGGVARVGGLIGVAEEGGCIPCASGEQRDIVESTIKRCAVGDHAMVHLVHPGVQTRATR